MAFTPLEPQSRCGDKPLEFQVICPQNGAAVLKGFRGSTPHPKTDVSNDELRPDE